MRAAVGGHGAMLAALTLALALRALAVLGYPPALWFWADSFTYVRAALDPEPAAYRTVGYSFLLKLLEPLHDAGAVAVLQHLMGLVLAVVVYALLRRSLPGWAATLLVTPLLLDEFQILLEHMIMAETLFTALVTGAVAVLLRAPRPGVADAVAAGAMLGAAVTVRTVALPLVLLALAWLLVRRAGWRPVLAGALAAAVPLVAYLTWFRVERGVFALSQAEGIFLYARTTTFADCDRMRPPPAEARLCPGTPPGSRPKPARWIWDASSPLNHLPKGSDRNGLAGDFARRAILAQPGDFLRAGLADLAPVFRWPRRDPVPIPGNPYEFPSASRPLRGASAEAARAYHDGPPETRVAEPYAGWLRAYQRWGYLPGPALAALLLAGLGGIVISRRRAEILLPWATAVALLALPPFIVGFDLRYAMPAVPAACLAAGLALDRSAWTRRTRRSAGSGGSGGVSSGGWSRRRGSARPGAA
ncbi:hypothetical protein [Bailinhaonella thermotolerans]|uniref:Glycosyltransferase RgtA/B/C/D-like domain-containing protein n=1 Tax=Bailinhaonella thermotolerans TaxID=1070861 RepID=A0A3A4AUI7_9ACTN|nr:hypothetical protein [Bailinhaonella thermotolerans]RJL30984.1 hypothetical protein D5H75_22145 [Bailinhaonella thermotolerans]